MVYDHILIHSGKGNFSSSGINELFEMYPPRKVLLLYQGELQHPPDYLKNLVVNSYKGEFLPETKLTGLGESTSELETKALPYTVFQEMQSAIVNHFPECFHDNTKNELVTTMMSGSGFHRQLFLGLSITMNTTFVTIDRDKGTPIITSQKWINEGFNHNLSTPAQEDLLRAFLIQLTMDGRSGTKPNGKMSAENIIKGLDINTIANANGVSNPAEPLINKEILKKIPDSDPVLYQITGKGWITALKVLSEQLEKHDMPLSGYNIGDNRFLEDIYSKTGEVTGRVCSVKGLFDDSELKAIGIENKFPSVPVVMTIFSRIYDNFDIGTISDPEFELTGNKGSFIAAREKWEHHIISRHQKNLDWCLFNASGKEIEESFRLLCMWLWPRITGLQYTASDQQTRNIQWSIDSTHFDLQQNICISLFSFLFSIPITYLQRSDGPPGTSGRPVKFIGNPEGCIVSMPNRELMKTMSTKINNSPSKILIALWLREIENQRLQDEHESTITDFEDPFEESHDSYSPPPNEVYIEDLHSIILKLVEEGTVDSKFQLDVGGKSKTDIDRRAQQWRRGSAPLSKLCLAQQVPANSGTKKNLKITPIGRIVAEKLYTQLVDGE